ncbi:MAG: SusD/RagB family nutrient-binding outer membrane lipoprotein [Bacteroidia bacterium]|nr:SusD/RagB family nutrient-binding outer membrane lipoprotein [Bacteroidia bacterium]
MKYFKLLIIVLLAGALSSNCTGDFEELNTRPDALIATNVDASLLGQAFARGQYYGMHGLHWRFQISQSLFSDLYSQYFATTAANFDSDRYVEVGRWIDLAWSSFYGQAAPNIKFVEDFARDNGLPLEEAIAKVWRVQAYHRQTDYWGPIIYSQFGNGETSVSYDSQEDIYNDFFTTLDEAIATLESSRGGNAFGANDQIYGGDVDQWIKFANSLRLRLAMRIAYANPSKAQSEAEKAFSGGVMEVNADNAFMITTANSLNPYTTITNWGEFRMSALMESILKGYEDPRAGIMFSPAASGDQDGDGFLYEGLRNGQAKVNKVPELNGNNSDIGQSWLPVGKGGSNPAIQIMTRAEVFFLRAEGALRGWNMGGTAQDLYESGIRASMEDRAGAAASDIDAYIASTNTPAIGGDPAEPNSAPPSDIPVAYDAAGDFERQLEQIITQKWIAIYPDGWEAYAEVRRTGYPKLYPLLNSDNPDLGTTDIFRRMTYVDGEFSNNADAVTAAQSHPELVGGDKNSTKVWWDKK